MAENAGKSFMGTAATFIIGSIVGAGAALLLAPENGKETRKRVSSWIKDWRGRTKEYLAEEREAFSRKTEQLRAAVEAGKEAYEEHGEPAKKEPHHNRHGKLESIR